MLPLAPNTLTRPDAIRFLQRATFGARPGDDEALIAQGVDAWFIDQFARQPTESILARRRRRNESMFRAHWRGALIDPAQLRKRVAYALSQIFVVSRREAGHSAVAAYADLLESNAFGTYRELLERITLSAAMGEYLTYVNNRKADARRGRVPDENYAREVMQLFSIGLWELEETGERTLVGGEPVPTYDNDDIVGLARVFTGWRLADVDGDARYTRPMVMRESDHEPGVKAFLGVTIPAGTLGAASLTIALDTLADHPNVGPFMSRQLIQRLVTSNPTPAYVARVGAVWADDGAGKRGNLAAVVQAILTDDEVWQSSPPQTFGKLREPALRFTVVARALAVGATDDNWRFDSLEDAATELGQQPFLSPSVFNFYRPGYVPPQTLLADSNLTAPEFELANESSAIGWVNWLSRTLRRPPGATTFDVDTLLPLVDDVPALVVEVAARLCPPGISGSLREIVERRVAAIESRNIDRQNYERVMATVLLIAASTDFLYER